MLALFRNGWLRIRFGGLPSLLISCFFASANFAQTSVPVNVRLRLLFGKPLHKRAAAESYELFVKRSFGMAL